MSMALAQEHLREEAGKLEAQFQVEDEQVYVLELRLHTPLMVSRYKTDVPVPGLPNLDGILQYAAFYWCASACALQHPNLATHYLWQTNDAFEGRGWIDFAIPLRRIPIKHPGTSTPQWLYDCSVGLPVDPRDQSTCYPVGNNLLIDSGASLKRIVDHLPLRRRVSHPKETYKPIQLTTKLDTSRGPNKAMDNRMYTLVVHAYRFYFRGDAQWVQRLINKLSSDGVGIGKKVALGYGCIEPAQVSLVSSSVQATLGHPLTEGQKQVLRTEPGTEVIALLKNIPSDVLFEWCAADGKQNLSLLGCPKVKVLSLIPIFGGYTPPYWLKFRQTLVAQYGSLLYGES